MEPRVKREGLAETQVTPTSEPAEAAEQTERRLHPRVPVSVDVEIVDTKSGAHIAGRATDFGVGGCYVDTLNTLPQGTPVEVFLNWQGRTLRMRALVSYAVSDRSIGMGLAFIGASDKHGASLLEWVTGLSNDPPADVWQRHKAEPSEQTGSETQSPLGARQALYELLVVLARKKVLSRAEVTELLRLLEAASSAEQR
jgi:hypothetical protein